jgi:hypothetical protein
MGKMEILLEVPNWVETGVSKGQLEIFGGVVRNNQGQIVCMLKETIEKGSKYGKGRIAIIAIAGAVVAGTGYLAYKKFSKKGKAINQLQVIDKAALNYATKAKEGNLNIKDLEKFSNELVKFIGLMSQDKYKDVEIVVDEQTIKKLEELYFVIYNFNKSVCEIEPSSRPTLPEPVKHDDLLEIIAGINTQIKFQEDALEYVYRK